MPPEQLQRLLEEAKNAPKCSQLDPFALLVYGELSNLQSTDFDQTVHVKYDPIALKAAAVPTRLEVVPFHGFYLPDLREEFDVGLVRSSLCSEWTSQQYFVDYLKCSTSVPLLLQHTTPDTDNK